jgi:4-hydroxyacetophenone monooxygenase
LEFPSIVIRGFGSDICADYVPWAGGLLRGTLPPPAQVPVPAGYRVLIIGAAVSGLCAAAFLRNMGIEFVLVEKSPQVGGTWFDNRYPGCGVDTPNHQYSFSFVDNDWTRFFCRRDELKAYLDKAADELKIR